MNESHLDDYPTFDFKSDEEIAKMDEKQKAAYKYNLMKYWEITSVLETAYEKGYLEGLRLAKTEKKKEEMIEFATRMKEYGEPIDKIKKYTGLTIEEIEAL